MLRCSAVIFSTLTPGPSSTSYRVTVGPRVQPVTAASTLNCSRTDVIESAMWSLAALRFLGGSPATSRLSDGNVYGPSTTRSSTKLSCLATDLAPRRRPRATAGSGTVGLSSAPTGEVPDGHACASSPPYADGSS